MDETAIFATILVPTRVHELVMVAFRIKKSIAVPPHHKPAGERYGA
jgi:hypothetical protein